MTSTVEEPPPLPHAASFKIALYRDKLDTTPIQASVSWETFVEFLVNHVEESPCTVEAGPSRCIGKECPYKSHSALPDNPMAWSPVEIVGKRLDVNVRAVTLLALDFDHITKDVAQAVEQRLSAYEHVSHTTHNHRDDDVAFRSVLLTSRPVPTNQYHRFLAAAVRFLDVPADPTCKNRSRLYYRPSHPKGAPHGAVRARGRVLDVDEVLAWADVHLPAYGAGEQAAGPLPEEADWDLDSDAVVAAIDVAARYFPDRRRNDICLAYAGMLRRAGCAQEDAKYIVREICVQGGSTDPDARARTVDHTYGLSDESWMTGFTRVSEILAESIGDEEEAESVAKEFGNYVTDARNEAFLRGLSVAIQPASGEAQSVVATSVVDLSVLQDAVSDLAAKRSKSLERSDKIAAVLLRRVLNKQPLAQLDGLGDVETVHDGADRGVTPDSAVHGVASTLAFCFPRRTPWEAAFEVMRHSIVSIQKSNGEDWVALAKRSYESAVVYREKQEAKRAAERAASEAIERKVLESNSTSYVENWRDRLQKAAGGDYKASLSNAQLILEHDEQVAGTIRWNEHDKRLEVHGGALARAGRRIGAEDIVINAENFLARVWNIEVDHVKLRRRIYAIGRDHAYDPLADYLRSLRWDGGLRVDTCLIRYFGAKDTPHNRRIGRRWMVGAAARALEPGCKFDNVLIFEQMQGAKKSSAFEALAGRFYCSTEINLRDKDTKMLASVSWIIELAEMTSVRRSEIDQSKAFLTTRSDKFRPPFGAEIETAPRRCVFVGTVNERRYLLDSTGNRRYWPVRCGETREIDVPGLLRDHEVLWAEAVAIYFAYKTCPDCAVSDDTVHGQDPRCVAHRWWLDKREEKEAADVAGDREEEQPWMAWADKILAWWRKTPPKDRARSMTTTSIAEDVGDVAVDRFMTVKGIQTAIGIAMDRLGFARRGRVYIPTEKLLNEPWVKGGPGLFAIDGGKQDEKDEKDDKGGKK